MTAFLVLALFLAIVVGFNVLPGSETERAGPGRSQQAVDTFTLYQQPGDESGRTVLYQKGGFFERSYFGGVGEQERAVGPAENPVKLPYIVGTFSIKGWEETDGGYYIYLENPETGEQIGQKMKLLESTSLAVEDVSRPRPFEWLQASGSVADFTKEQLSLLVQPGDAVVVELLRDGEEVVVDHLIIRRFGGLKTLEKENE